MKRHWEQGFLISLTCSTVLLAAGCVGPGALRAGTSPPDADHTTACQPISQTEVVELFDRWNRSLATLDANKVVANYATDSVLLPTQSDRPRTTHDEIHNYFVDFVKKEPQAKVDLRFIRYGCNQVQDIGNYTFTFKNDRPLQARFTYVYRYQDGKWLILHHHSSDMPKPPKP